MREGRRTGEFQVRLVTSQGELDRRGTRGRRRRRRRGAVDADLGRRRGQPGRRDGVARGLRVARGGTAGDAVSPLARRPSSRPTPRWRSGCIQTVIEYAQPSGFERVYDLYCGIGTIGLLMAPRVGQVHGLELFSEAVADAIVNARENEIDNARFYAGDVRLSLRELVARAGRPDIAVVDPPRAGLSKKVVRRDHRGESPPNRLCLLQPDHARAQRRPARGGGLQAHPRPTRRHVPADATHRVRGAAGATARVVKGAPVGAPCPTSSGQGLPSSGTA